MCVPLLEEREERVDVVELLPIGVVGELPRAREVLVDLTRGQLPGNGAVEVADLDNRLDQLVDRRRRQPGRVPRPLVLGERVDKEAVLVLSGYPGLASPLNVTTSAKSVSIGPDPSSAALRGGTRVRVRPSESDTSGEITGVAPEFPELLATSWRSRNAQLDTPLTC